MTIAIAKNYTHYSTQDIIEVGWTVMHGDECMYFEFSVHRAVKGSPFARFEKVRTKKGDEEWWLFMLDPPDLPDTMMAMQALPGTSLPAQYTNLLAKALWSRFAHRMDSQEDVYERRVQALPAVAIIAEPTHSANRRSKEEILDERKKELQEKLAQLTAQADYLMATNYRADVSELLRVHRKAEEIRRYLVKRGVEVPLVSSPEQAIRTAAEARVAVAIRSVEKAKKGEVEDE